MLFDVVTDAAQWFAEQCVAASTTATSATATAVAVPTPSTPTKQDTRVPFVLASDSDFIVAQSVRYRQLGFAFSWCGKTQNANCFIKVSNS